MIWVQHDFYKNFLRSFKSGDINLSLDIFRSEISDILTNKTEDLLSLLHKLKIKHKKKQSYEELLDIVLHEMKVNEKFVRGLSFIIGQNNNVIRRNPKVSWVKLLDGIKKGIEQIAKYFEENPRQEMLFRKKTLEMVELKSSVTGDDTRPMLKKDNTIVWIFGIVVVGVAGYMLYRHFQKIKESKLRIESMNLSEVPKMEIGGDINLNQPINPINPIVQPLPQKDMMSLRPEYNVSPDVLLPENNITQMSNTNQAINPNIPNHNNQASGQSAVNINVQPVAIPQQNQNNIQSNNNII